MSKYQYSLSELANKLRIVYLPLPNSESVFVSLIGKIGRRAEAENEVGAAHFLEHLSFDGTMKRPTALDVSKFLEYYGGEYNGFTSAEVVKYYVKILPENASSAFDYLSDIFFNSQLKEIEKERKVIAQEASSNRDDPRSLLERTLLGSLYPNQAIGRTIFDEEENLGNINRDVLESYRSRNYIVRNFVLAVAGNIEEKKALSLAKEFFGDFPDGKEVVFEKAEIRKEKNLKIIQKDVVQSKLEIDFRGFESASFDRNAALVLAIILGRGMSSRLFHCLRNQEHLVYSVNSSHRSFSNTGYFCIRTFVSEENLQKSVNKIFEEIQKLLAQGITDEELQKAKNMLLSEFLFKMESIGNYTFSLGQYYLLNGKFKEILKEVEEIKSIGKDEVMRVAEYVFSDSPKVTAITKSLKNLEIP